MLDEKEIDSEISRLEYIESSYSNYSKLADLYIIKDRMNKNCITEAVPAFENFYSPPEETVIGLYGDSEFLQMIAGKNYKDIFKIIDELMDTLKVVNQKAYHSILMKIDGI